MGTLRFPTAVENSPRNGIHSCTNVVAQRTTTTRCAAQQHEPCVLLLTFGPARAAVRGGRSGPAGGIGMDADSFSSGQEPRRKARPTLTDRPALSAGDATGVPFSLVTFSWASKRK